MVKKEIEIEGRSLRKERSVPCIPNHDGACWDEVALVRITFRDTVWDA
jgi:hypothetical protein